MTNEKEDFTEVITSAIKMNDKTVFAIVSPDFENLRFYTQSIEKFDSRYDRKEFVEYNKELGNPQRIVKSLFSSGIYEK